MTMVGGAVVIVAAAALVAVVVAVISAGPSSVDVARERLQGTLAACHAEDLLGRLTCERDAFRQYRADIAP